MMPRADRTPYVDRFDHFAELLSLDIPMPEIGRRLGMTRGGTGNMLRKLRDKYGWQAQ